MRIENLYCRNLDEAKEYAPWVKAIEKRGYSFIGYEDPQDLEDKRNKEAKEIAEAYKTLGKYGKPKIEFQTFDNHITSLIDLIKSLDWWNDFNPDVVAKTIEEFFNKLPKAYYNEGNPNNGNAEFERIELEGDSAITFEAFSIKPFTEEHKKEIEKLADEYGKIMQADEKTLYEEPNYFNDNIISYYYHIRFWWD